MSPVNPFSSSLPLIALSIGALVIVAGYTFFVAAPYMAGPSLTVIAPLENSTETGQTVTITGTTERVAYLSINDLPTPLLEDGTFTMTRSYPPGYTVLVIRARDRFGHEVSETIRFLHTYNPLPHGPKKEDE
jgi:hypothetical protein